MMFDSLENLSRPGQCLLCRLRLPKLGIGQPQP
jgi:hypothetical protein